MRLISLTSNKSSFRPIHFNESGLTLIRGKQKHPETSDSGKTYNGVGKSLAITLIHFCLGSNKNEAFALSIPDWEFSLSFSVGTKVFVSSRNTSKQETIILNGEEFSLGKFKDELQALLFDIPSAVSGLSFRLLINRFIRPKKASYVTFDCVRKNESDYQSLQCCGFLLGLDSMLIQAKQKLKKERDRIEELRRNLSKDTIFVEFFTGNKNVDIELIDLNEEIAQIGRELAAFQVAENYSDLEKEADKTRLQLQAKRNREVLLQNAIENINISIKSRPDVAPERLFQIYEEAKAKLPEAIVKSVNEVSEFHKQLLANRIKRLTAEKNRLGTELDGIRAEIVLLNKSLDIQLQFLNAHGALEEFLKLSNYLSSLKAKAQKIRDYKELLEKYSSEAQSIALAMSNETIKASSYLKEVAPVLENNFEKFRSLSKRFYPTKPGGLVVENNEGENQIRFNISAHIQDDASDGINEVKIFCFDMTLLLGRHGHTADFLIHDSRLYSDIDFRQRATLFKLADEICLREKLQYIATVNEDQINAMKSEFKDEEFKRIILNNIKLDLTDDANSEKLLGIQVDMRHAGDD
jgi:uncharacterized protein YydD (DUF2326 family)